MQFKDIVGQEQTKQLLRQAVQEGRVPHAQLFCGPAGSGKLPLALAYAQYLQCEHRTPEDSCGVCPTCLQYKRLQHPDLHFAFPIVKTDSGDVCDDFADRWREQLIESPYFDLDDWMRRLGVETKQSMIYEKESGEILRKLNLKAFGDGYKVMLIWLPEKMNIACANKLLKLLEEPPEKTLFLLVSEQPDMLLSTILSRVQQVRLSRLSEAEIMAGAGVTEDLAHIANGSLLAAIRLRDEDEQNKQFHHDFVNLMRDAYTVGQIQDAGKKFESLQRLRDWSLYMADSKMGREKQKAFLQYAQRQVRENYIFNFSQPAMSYLTSEEQNFSERFARFIHSDNVEKIMHELDVAEQQISQNGNAKMIFFDLALQMIVLIKRK